MLAMIQHGYPNIVYIDNLQTGDSPGTVQAINQFAVGEVEGVQGRLEAGVVVVVEVPIEDVISR
jgi:hypothetical protein